MSDDYAAKLMMLPCHYCGDRPEGFAGIDRVDNTKSYTKENSVPCCAVCNYAKLDRPVEEFRQWIDKVFGNLPVGH